MSHLIPIAIDDGFVMRESRGRAEWLNLLMRCQNGEATCLYVLNEIEAEHVPLACLMDLDKLAAEACRAVEAQPAGPEQTALSIKISALAHEIQRLLYWRSKP